MNRTSKVLTVIVVAGAAAIAAIYLSGSNIIQVGSMVMNYFRSEDNPAGTIALETRSKVTTSAVAPAVDALGGNWPSYNRTLASDRYSPLASINAGNAAQLKVLCTYDTRVHEPSETGPLVIDGTLTAPPRSTSIRSTRPPARRTGAPTRRARSACCR